MVSFAVPPPVVNTVVDRTETTEGYEWELDWPAILYAPIAEIGQRPLGLLVIGCRRDHWYTDDDVAYAHTLGYALAPMVGELRWPLSRLNESEVEVAQLLFGKRGGRIDLLVTGPFTVALELDRLTPRRKSIGKLRTIDGVRLIVLRDHLLDR